MSSRRKIEIGADGKADVLILTDPIPRHLSIVSWGANDLPARTWKSAASVEEAHSVLRSFPSHVVDLATLNLPKIQQFVAETLDAWNASVQDVLAHPLRAADRSARIQALTAQAGARVAALGAATVKMISIVTRSYKTVGLQLAELPSTSTLQGELDRREFCSALEHACAVITDKLLSVMRDSNGSSPTHDILQLFGDVGSSFSTWAAMLPDGVVGVSIKSELSTSEKKSGKTDKGGLPAHDHTYSTGDVVTGLTAPQGQTIGHNHGVKPGALYTSPGGNPEHIHYIGMDLAGSSEKAAEEQQQVPQSEEKKMITVTDLQRLAEENPVGFVVAFKTAVEMTNDKSPSLVKKFMWGETGVEQHDPAAIISLLKEMQKGDMFASMVASAVAGIDVSVAAERDNTQVASTMRSSIIKLVTSDITANPKGELAQAVKAALAPDIAETVSECMKTVLNSMSDASGGRASLLSFDLPENDDPLKVVYPGARR